MSFMTALRRTLRQMFSGPFIWVLARALGGTLLLFAALFWGAGQASAALLQFDWQWVNAGLSVLAKIGLVIAFVFLLLPVAALFAGLFAEDVASAVEARYYPSHPAPRPLGWLTSLSTALTFFAVMVVLNLALLPFYLLLPGLNVILFLIVNAYLIGREYFELVAMRHYAPPQVRKLRREYRGRLFLTGLLIAIPLSIPLVNLCGPLFGTAFMVHVFKDIERRADLG